MTTRSRNQIRRLTARAAVLLLLVSGGAVATLAAAPVASAPTVQRVQFTGAGDYLVAEFLDDDLVHL